MIIKIKLLLLAGSIFSVSNLSLAPSILTVCLRTPRNDEFDEIDSELLHELEYKIDVNDQLSFQLYTNNGFQLIDMFKTVVLVFNPRE